MLKALNPFRFQFLIHFQFKPPFFKPHQPSRFSWHKSQPPEVLGVLLALNFSSLGAFSIADFQKKVLIYCYSWPLRVNPTKDPIISQIVNSNLDLMKGQNMTPLFTSHMCRICFKCLNCISSNASYCMIYTPYPSICGGLAVMVCRRVKILYSRWQQNGVFYDYNQTEKFRSISIIKWFLLDL